MNERFVKMLGKAKIARTVNGENISLVLELHDEEDINTYISLIEELNPPFVLENLDLSVKAYNCLTIYFRDVLHKSPCIDDLKQMVEKSGWYLPIKKLGRKTAREVEIKVRKYGKEN